MARRASNLGAYEISSLPGQSQVAVTHGFVVPEGMRGQGNAHRLKEQQQRDLASQHYDFALCTVASGNTAQKRVLAKRGWKCMAMFRNRRSCETTELWGCEL